MGGNQVRIQSEAGDFKAKFYVKNMLKKNTRRTCDRCNHRCFVLKSYPTHPSQVLYEVHPKTESSRVRAGAHKEGDSKNGI